METKKTSDFLRLNAADFLKGLVMAVGAAVLTVLSESINAGNFQFNWPDIWHIALATSVTYLIKNLFTGAQTIIKILFLVVCLSTLFVSRGSAQSMFKPLPKAKAQKAGVYSMTLTPQPNGDSLYQGFRFDGPSVLYAFPDNNIFTGIGISYEHDTYHHDTQKWYSDWSVALKGYEGGQFAPNNLTAVTALGLSVSFFNKLLTVGVLYNLTNKKFQGAVGPTVSLNN
jgi:hypothetical protein